MLRAMLLQLQLITLGPRVPSPPKTSQIASPHDLIVVGLSGVIRIQVPRAISVDTILWTLADESRRTPGENRVPWTRVADGDTVRVTVTAPRYGLFLLTLRHSADTTQLRTTVAFVPKTTPDPRLGLHIYDLRWFPPIGVGSVRLWDSRTDWVMIAPSRGTFNWARLDSLVSQAETQGVRLLLTLANTPRWASREPDRPAPPHPAWPGSTVLPRDMKDWSLFVDTVTRRYANRLDAIEVWNEPNYSFFSDGPQGYASLLTIAASAVRGSRVHVNLLAPAVAGQNFYAFVDSVARAAGPVSFDAFSMHTYPPQSQGPEAWLPVVLRKTDSLLAHWGWPRAIWVTEAGYWIAPRRNGWPMSEAEIDSAAPPLTRPNWVNHWPYRPAAEDSAAAFIVREHALLFGEGVARVYWYHWTYKDFGLTDTTGAPKAPVVAYAALVARIGGLTQHTRLADGPLVYAYRFSNGTRSVIVAWSTASSGSDWTAPPAQRYVAYDIWGNPIPQVQPPQTVRLGPMPIYLESP